MGISWSRSAERPTADQRIINHVSAADEDVSASTAYSATSTNLTTWVSQSSSSFTNIWGNGAPDPSTYGQLIANSNLRAFTYAQMKAATHNFRFDMVVGKGGFGNVYKGWLKEKVQPTGIRKIAIAVKKLDLGSAQGFREWIAEVSFLGSLSHPNIVKLLGYCSEESAYIIVYEFLKNGSLNNHLYGKRSVRPLSWYTRLKVAIGTAQALYHLHTLERPIIMKDFKSSNILLDESYNAKISDFGLASFAPLIDDSPVDEHCRGTMGYMDPEYVHTGRLFVKSDVYSFGVVLAEILTGLRAVDKKRPAEKRDLVDWIKPHLTNKRKLKNIMDYRLEGKYPLKDGSIIAHLAFRCLQPTPQLRPSMKEVVEILQQIEAGCKKRVT